MQVTQTNVAASMPEPHSEPKPSKRIVVGIVILVVGLVVASMAAWFFFLKKTPASNIAQNTTTSTTSDDTADQDQDGISDAAEVKLGTDPKKSDTDGDGYSDSAELFSGFDPKSAGGSVPTTNSNSSSLPILSDAQNIYAKPGTGQDTSVSYSTGKSVDEAKSFYTSELQKAGWTITGSSTNNTKYSNTFEFLAYKSGLELEVSLSKSLTSVTKTPESLRLTVSLYQVEITTSTQKPQDFPQDIPLPDGVMSYIIPKNQITSGYLAWFIVSQSRDSIYNFYKNAFTQAGWNNSSAFGASDEFKNGGSLSLGNSEGYMVWLRGYEASGRFIARVAKGPIFGYQN